MQLVWAGQLSFKSQRSDWGLTDSFGPSLTCNLWNRNGSQTLLISALEFHITLCFQKETLEMRNSSFWITLRSETWGMGHYFIYWVSSSKGPFLKCVEAPHFSSFSCRGGFPSSPEQVWGGGGLRRLLCKTELMEINTSTSCAHFSASMCQGNRVPAQNFTSHWFSRGSQCLAS